MIPSFLGGIGASAALIGFQSMMADAADEHEILFGARREGLYFAGISLSAKASSGIGALIAGLVLDLIGFPHGLPPAAERGACHPGRDGAQPGPLLRPGRLGAYWVCIADLDALPPRPRGPRTGPRHPGPTPRRRLKPGSVGVAARRNRVPSRPRGRGVLHAAADGDAGLDLGDRLIDRPTAAVR